MFSFGIVLWEILTGDEPYANMHYGAIIGVVFFYFPIAFLFYFIYLFVCAPQSCYCKKILSFICR